MAYLLGIETGVEPLVSPSHLMLFLGAFLMLDYVLQQDLAKIIRHSLSCSGINNLCFSYVYHTVPSSIFTVRSFFGYETLLRQGHYFFNLCLQALCMCMRYDLKCTKANVLALFLSFICIGTCFFRKQRLMVLIIGVGSLLVLGYLE